MEGSQLLFSGWAKFYSAGQKWPVLVGDTQPRSEISREVRKGRVLLETSSTAGC